MTQLMARTPVGDIVRRGYFNGDTRLEFKPHSERITKEEADAHFAISTADIRLSPGREEINIPCASGLNHFEELMFSIVVNASGDWRRCAPEQFERPRSTGLEVLDEDLNFEIVDGQVKVADRRYGGEITLPRMFVYGDKSIPGWLGGD